jgi:hypothetical protein
MLRLVEAPKEGQEKRTFYRPPSKLLRLTAPELERLRAALRSLKQLHGTWKALAEAMGVSPHSLKQVSGRSKNGSYALALRVAKVANVSLETLLSPLASVDVCPTCGARKGAK